ncbi:MAG: undecaprenyl/decaprenyl-phosphate alpha-N-acetylglucosaminyl 1-phosphate transferase [Candidatus Moranbacteria bacterium]|nr:undecaprenyl/decaprenyl-phosphate alpha-N-acetylglucosaminyl 1-phosphate transferase [Candidatus Moranbacteria bacterium]
MSLFAVPFLLALGGSIILSLFFSLPYFRSSRNRVGSRHRHNGMFSRFGGIAIILAFFFAIGIDQHLVMTRPLWGLVAGGVFIFLFGLADDFFELDWKTQLLFQVALGVIVYFFSIRIDFVTNPFGGIIDFSQSGIVGLSFFVTLAWILLLINAVNWLDGADGLLGSVGSIAAITVFFVSLRPEVHQPPIALLSAALLGAIIGFLLFNIPPARIFAGTTGSMFIGFSLAVLAMIAGSKIATTVLVLALPIVDAIIVVLWRVFSGESIFHPDERHIHFRLMKLGWSSSKIFLTITLFTGLIATIALQASPLFKAIAFLFILGCFTLFFFWLERALKRKQSV